MCSPMLIHKSLGQSLPKTCILAVTKLLCYRSGDFSAEVNEQLKTNTVRGPHSHPTELEWQSPALADYFCESDTWVSSTKTLSC